MECKGCGGKTEIPYLVHEGTMSRMERIIRRLWIICIILISLFVLSNIAWLVYESQYADNVTMTQRVDQDAEGDGSNTFVGGDYTNG